MCSSDVLVSNRQTDDVSSWFSKRPTWFPKPLDFISVFPLNLE